MTRLQDLYTIGGQSPWLDNLRRDWLESGELAALIHLGVRGITSNPTIFANAISGQDTYDDQFRELMKDHTVESAYWEMAITDIQNALELLRPLYDESDREDGYVSLEVSPAQAHDTDSTVASARLLHETIDQPNLFVKVPATKEGVPAIRTLIGEGKSINVTLIFGLDRYDEVDRGLPERPRGRWSKAGRADELPKVASVASFFVSRVDTEVDRRLETLAGGESGDAAVLGLRGTAAVAQAQVAYQHFHQAFSGERWEALRGMGARVQRPLWASTSTKNKNVLGPALRRRPDRAGDGQHHAGRHAAGVRGSRHLAPHGRCRPGRGAGRPRRHQRRPVSTWRTWSRRSRTRAWRRSPSRSTSCSSR